MSIEQKRKFLQTKATERCQKMFTKVNKTSAESISFDDILRAYGPDRYETWSAERMQREKQCFLEVDKDNDGLITWDELYQWVLQEVKDEWQ